MRHGDDTETDRHWDEAKDEQDTKQLLARSGGDEEDDDYRREMMQLRLDGTVIQLMTKKENETQRRVWGTRAESMEQ